jgi:hypothetical protein
MRSPCLPFEWRWTNYTFRATGGTGTLSLENLEGPVTLAGITVKAAEGTLPKSQSIDFSTTNRIEFGAPAFALSATASSGLPVTFSVVSGPGIISNNLLSVTGIGAIVVRASQVGNDLFAAAPDVDRTILIEQGHQLIQFAEIPPVRFGDAPVKLVATSSAGLSVSFELVSGPGELNGDVLTFKGAGVIRVGGLQSGNAEYLPAAAVLDIPIGKALQSITFTLPSRIVVGFPITLTAAASSGLPVSFEVLSGPGALAEGGVLNAEGEGEIVINTVQPGDGNFEPAPAVQRSVRVITLPRLKITMTLNGWH